MKTITVTRRGVATSARDAQGNSVRLPDVSFPIVVRAYAPVQSDESAPSNGAQVITGYRIYGPHGLILRPDDRLTIAGVAGWQVEGEVGAWSSAFNTNLGGTEFVVRRSS